MTWAFAVPGEQTAANRQPRPFVTPQRAFDPVGRLPGYVRNDVVVVFTVTLIYE